MMISSPILKRSHSLVIGKKTAKLLKENIGSAKLTEPLRTMTVVGRDIVSGLPVQMEINSAMIYEAIKDDLNNLCTSIRMILEKVPPELAKDIVYSGIYLTGGSAKISALAELFTEVTNISVNVAENADESAAYGLHLVLSDEKYRALCLHYENQNIQIEGCNRNMKRKKNAGIPSKYLLLMLTIVCILMLFISYLNNFSGGPFQIFSNYIFVPMQKGLDYLGVPSLSAARMLRQNRSCWMKTASCISSWKNFLSS